MQGNSLFLSQQSSEEFDATSQLLSELHTTEDYDLNGQLSMSFVSQCIIHTLLFCDSSHQLFIFFYILTFGVKDYTTAAPTSQLPITLSAEQQFDGAELNKSGLKDLTVEDRNRASPNVDVAVINSTSTLTQEVRTTSIFRTCLLFKYIDLLKLNSIIFINKLFIPLSDCFRVTRNFGGDCFAQTRRLFASETKEEEQGAWKGKAGTQICASNL